VGCPQRSPRRPALPDYVGTEWGCPQRSPLRSTTSSSVGTKWGSKQYAKCVLFCYTVTAMFTTYILQSDLDGRYYYGYTEQDVAVRLKEHNDGKSFYTKKYRPWKLVWYAVFQSKKQAQDFERYLKTPSGHAFSRKRLV